MKYFYVLILLFNFNTSIDNQVQLISAQSKKHVKKYKQQLIVVSNKCVPMHVTCFISKYLPLASKLQDKHNIPIELTLAQCAIESSYGRSNVSRKYNNFFGISYRDKNKKSCYRKYKSIELCFQDYAKVLNQKCYRSCNSTNINEWCEALKHCYYAEDPFYEKKVKFIVNNYINKSLKTILVYESNQI